MRSPQKVMLCESTTALRGVRQFYSLIEANDETKLADVIIEKEMRLLKIFSDVSFHQAVVFVRRVAWGESLARGGRLCPSCPLCPKLACGGNAARAGALRPHPMVDPPAASPRNTPGALVVHASTFLGPVADEWSVFLLLFLFFVRVDGEVQEPYGAQPVLQEP